MENLTGSQCILEKGQGKGQWVGRCFVDNALFSLMWQCLGISACWSAIMMETRKCLFVLSSLTPESEVQMRLNVWKRKKNDAFHVPQQIWSRPRTIFQGNKVEINVKQFHVTVPSDKRSLTSLWIPMEHYNNKLIVKLMTWRTNCIHFNIINSVAKLF